MVNPKRLIPYAASKGNCISDDGGNEPDFGCSYRV